MCICINCRHMNNCKTYAFIQKKHNIVNYNLLKYEVFIPEINIMNINANMNDTFDDFTVEWDLIECSSFIEKPGCWLYQYE